MNKNTTRQVPTATRQLTLGWLYPDLMSTYGDRGNIIIFKKRCEWRSIECNILPINEDTTQEQLGRADIIFGGGSQDREQEIVMRDLRGKKGSIIKRLIEANRPALFVCGSPQLMGNFYEPAEGKRIEGLGIFDMESIHPGQDKPRLIGNVVARVDWENLDTNATDKPEIIVGFENHGGRTYLRNNAKPFATVLSGFGNNGEDGTEGAVYKNAIGCYFHGPILSKNPQIGDFLLKKALEVKYGTEIELTPLEGEIEEKAKAVIATRLNVKL